MTFNPHQYGPELVALLEVDRQRPLGIAKSQARDRERILEAAMGLPGNDSARCCLAGLWLLYDFLDESHAVSQEISTPEGSLWHGVMHRREGDFGNAKYWFRQAGPHPVYEELSERLGAEWDPSHFVEDCQLAVRTGRDLERCLDWQQAEWELLFKWCWNQSQSLSGET